MQFVGNKQLQWFGHMRRMAEDNCQLEVWSGFQMGRKRRGRPKKTWIEGITNLMDRGLQDGDWEDRDE